MQASWVGTARRAVRTPKASLPGERIRSRRVLTDSIVVVSTPHPKRKDGNIVNRSLPPMVFWIFTLQLFLYLRIGLAPK